MALSMHSWAGPVSQQAALSTVRNFLNDGGSGIYPQSTPSSFGSIQLVYTELSSVNVTLPAYYIFSTGDGYVIVAGDDRADAILAYGNGDFDLNNIPCGAQFMLKLYKLTMDYLFSNPNLDVTGSNTQLQAWPMGTVASVAPMLTSQWYQDAPYHNECPEYGSTRCWSGCCCTSLSMLMYYWKYPAGLTEAVPAYTTITYGLHLDELPPTTFDWDNMLDTYIDGEYNSDQASAVAHLMRYVGQAEEMDYGPDGSGAATENILAAALRFGYDENARIVTKEVWQGPMMYTDAAWCNILKNELSAGHPVVYTGCVQEDDGTYGGHAFNVDGYDADQNKFHVNFGWGGEWDGYYSFNSFGSTDHYYNIYQQMLLGVVPADLAPEPIPDPMITVDKEEVAFEDVVVNDVVTETFVVSGTGLTGNLRLRLNDDTGDFAIDKTNISAAAASDGVVVTVTYNPIEACTSNATVTISGGGAESQTVTLTGTAYVPDPEIRVGATILNFGDVYNGYGKNMTLNVRGLGLTENISLSISGLDNQIFVYPSTITPADAAPGVEVTVRCFPTSKGQIRDNLVISSPGAGTVNIPITANFIKTSAFITPDQDTLSMNTHVGVGVSKQLMVTYRRFDGWLASPHIPFDPGDLIIPKDSLLIYTLCPFNFSIMGDNCFTVEGARTISSNGTVDTCLVTVSYHPRTAGSHNAEMTLVSNVAYPVKVALVGFAESINGDMDGNGVLGINDVVILIQTIMSGEAVAPSGASCDINGDGEITVDDILTLLNMLSDRR